MRIDREWVRRTVHIISSKPMISNCNAGIPTESRVTSWIFHSDWFVKYDSYRGSHYLLILEEERNAEKVCRHRKRISCKRNFVILKWLRLLHIFRITCQVSEPWTMEKIMNILEMGLRDLYWIIPMIKTYSRILKL